mmetsp:Transcript_17954/g.38566  ORF Transcript_17954/g.38566 Transcript_17954/m.38566 type:complete len:314 (+) Transcript_17954:767-1708(+)
MSSARSRPSRSPPTRASSSSTSPPRRSTRGTCTSATCSKSTLGRSRAASSSVRPSAASTTPWSSVAPRTRRSTSGTGTTARCLRCCLGIPAASTRWLGTRVILICSPRAPTTTPCACGAFPRARIGLCSGAHPPIWHADAARMAHQRPGSSVWHTAHARRPSSDGRSAESTPRALPPLPGVQVPARPVPFWPRSGPQRLRPRPRRRSRAQPHGCGMIARHARCSRAMPRIQRYSSALLTSAEAPRSARCACTAFTARTSAAVCVLRQPALDVYVRGCVFEAGNALCWEKRRHTVLACTPLRRASPWTICSTSA